MNILEHLAQRPIFPLQIGGIDLTITNGVITVWLAAFLVFIFFAIISRNLKMIPGKWQSLAEVIVLFLSSEITGQIPRDRDKWLPFIVAIFFFILFNNLLGLIPGMSSATGNINTTAALAITVFAVVQAAGIYHHGLLRYLNSFLPPGLPLPIAVLMIPIELISQLARPFSLAIRLFANMFAGHAVMLVLISLIFVFKSYIILPLPVLSNTMIMAFEIFVALIQAFIFTYLSGLYIATALEGH